MGIDDESDLSASLQIGPTTLGMVRLYIETETHELPLDFEPEEAEEIAEELLAAAARAREARASGGKTARGAKRRPDSARAEGSSGKLLGVEPGGRGNDGRPSQGAPKRRRGSGSSS